MPDLSGNSDRKVPVTDRPRYSGRCYPYRVYLPEFLRSLHQ